MRLPSRFSPKNKKMHLDHAKLFLLWFISKNKLHGYEIIKSLRQGGLKMATTARIYPLLSHMKTSGLISQKEVMTGKRIKKVYAITAEGTRFLSVRRKSAFSGIMADFLRDMLE